MPLNHNPEFEKIRHKGKDLAVPYIVHVAVLPRAALPQPRLNVNPKEPKCKDVVSAGEGCKTRSPNVPQIGFRGILH